jgi:DNA primase catalytic subunit
MAGLPSEAVRTLYFEKCFPAAVLSPFLGPGGALRCSSVEGKGADGKEFHHSLNRKWPTHLGTPANLRAALLNRPGTLSLHINTVVVAFMDRSSEAKTVAAFEGQEFCFDFDLKDWGKRRSYLCNCSEKQICDTCWLLAEITAAMCDVLLTAEVGLGPMLCVASGGKGFHLWWGSPQARQLDTQARLALIDQLFRRWQHPSGPFAKKALEKAKACLKKTWVTGGVVRRALLADSASRLASYLRDQARVEKPHFDWLETKGLEKLQPSARSHTQWKHFAQCVGETRATHILAELFWPVVDAAVTIGRGHLLKVPFSIHARSGKVALPLLSIQKRRPSELPTVHQIVEESQKEASSRGAVWQCWTEGVRVMQDWIIACQY